MERQLKQILKEQVIEEFHQHELDNLIVFFLAQYPTYPITNLSANKLESKYQEIYNLSFLASYIRYSDPNLLGSGMRDENVKEKLCFLHHHVGTILPTYRKFIWEDLITLEELKAWLPLLSDFRMKDRIMKCTKFSNQYKQFLNTCLDSNSFEYQNLRLLNERYPDVIIEIENLANNPFQEELYKFLIIMKQNSIILFYEEAVRKFYRIQGFLSMVSLDEISKCDFMIVAYLREMTSYIPSINTLEDLHYFMKEKERAHTDFLATEYDVGRLKWFYCKLFLGISSQTFEMVFVKIPPNHNEWYLLLKDLYQARFPLSLKGEMYQRFMKFGDLKPFLAEYLDSTLALEDFYSKKAFTYINPEHPIINFDVSKFTLLTIPLKDYQRGLKEKDKAMKVYIQQDSKFSYQAGCLIGLEEQNILSADEQGCYMKTKDMHPNCLVAFDTVTLEHLTVRESTGYPIVVINTEAYAKKMIQSLEAQFAAFNWEAYLEGKRNLYQSLKGHPWLINRYFNADSLYDDVEKWQERLEEWMQEKVPSGFLKAQLQVLERLLLLNEELERDLHFDMVVEKSFQYRKKMIQYEQLI